MTFWTARSGGPGDPDRVDRDYFESVIYTGIASPEHARRVADTLFAGGSFSGWGIRTLSSLELRYNPLSYHNGSIWPHDNALIAYGLARYGFRESALRIAAALFDVSRFMDLQRLPELFCGFPRHPTDPPTLYPVACSPQSWAVASVFLVAQACLGITVSPLQSSAVQLDRPLLPNAVEYADVKRLVVGGCVLDLRLRPGRDGVELDIQRRTGRAEVALSR